MPYGIFNSTRIAVEYDGLIAMAQRAGHGEQAGMYEIFGGKVEDGETPIIAANRELCEELGDRDGIEFLNLEPIEFKPYEITRGKNAGRQCRVFGFAVLSSSIDIQLDSREHVLGSEIWVPAPTIEHRQDVTKASKIAMQGLKNLFYFKSN
jgi:8-oxo-dGTP pyrophosphatase MutT (NUDIX family)